MWCHIRLYRLNNNQRNDHQFWLNTFMLSWILSDIKLFCLVLVWIPYDNVLTFWWGDQWSKHIVPIYGWLTSAEHSINHTNTRISDTGISSGLTPAIISIVKHNICASMTHNVIMIAAKLHECSTKQNTMAWKLHIWLYNYLLSRCFIPLPSSIYAAYRIPRILWCMTTYELRYGVYQCLYY